VAGKQTARLAQIGWQLFPRVFSDSQDEAAATTCSSIGYSCLSFVASSRTIGSSNRLTQMSAADMVMVTEE
jgi:hypothetical protein